MATLEFYGEKVEYDGKELGIYVTDSHLIEGFFENPLYTTFDVFYLEKSAKRMPKEKFVGMFERIKSDLAKTDAQDSRAVSINNTKEFVDKVLAALSGD